jgi:predicted nuclease of predicted toxin-antitoxin system
MGVSQRVVDFLRAASHDVVHLREQGLHRLPNGQIFLKAKAEQRIVMTFDLDFGEIVAGASGSIPSVVIFRLHNTRSEHVIERLEITLEQAGEALRTGAVVIVEEGRVRVRSLPFR